MKSALVSLVGGLTMIVAASSPRALSAGEGPVGLFDAHGDVGSPKLAGAAFYNAVSEEYTLRASGANLWGSRDEFHYAWTRLTGDFILQARVELIGKGVDPHRKLGLLVRPNLDADSPYVDGAIHGDGLTSLQFRQVKGGETAQHQAPLTGADVIELERKGNRFTLSVARFGETRVEAESLDLDLGETVYAGLFLCSHNPDVVEQGVFRNVRIIRPVKEGFTPYRDYIGSLLEILDVESGIRRVVHQSEAPFEAPNWTSDGKTLLINTSGSADGRGRIARFDLMTRQISFLDTGFARRNNNDHVLSFDGKLLGISDQSVGDGQSVVYVLPSEGGEPRRVTAKAPSYLHGFSPDGRFVVYTGGRGGEYDIYRMAVDGKGDEVNLTKTPGLDDGPEFSPDGRFVYFNSTRTGPMQIWRMKPDGSDPEQVTSDGWNDWFPHVSPDGKWLAFVSFPKDVPPAEHPYYKRVYLRVMPVDGGTPRVVAYVYGGQGTMNVPSWSPDGKMLAFVSNTGFVASLTTTGQLHVKEQ
jgi:TolB protein